MRVFDVVEPAASAAVRCWRWAPSPAAWGGRAGPWPRTTRRAGQDHRPLHAGRHDGHRDPARRRPAVEGARAAGGRRNKPGANSIVGAAAAASSPPDGHTIVMVLPAHAANATLQAGKMPFDPVAGFSPVSLVVQAPLVLAGSKQVPARTLQEFLDYAKRNPGKVNYGSSGIGATAHLAMELLKLRTGVRMEHIPYRGTQPALQDLMAGNIGLLFDTYSTLKPQFDAGTSCRWASPRPSAPPSRPTSRRSWKAGSTGSSRAPGACSSRPPARRRASWTASRPRSPRSSASRPWPRSCRTSASWWRASPCADGRVPALGGGALGLRHPLGQRDRRVALSISQFKREVAAERIRDRFAASRARGMWMGGKVPLARRLAEPPHPGPLPVGPAPRCRFRPLSTHLGCSGVSQGQALRPTQPKVVVKTASKALGVAWDRHSRA